MIKALFKKQMMEVFSWIYRNKKSGENRSVKGIVSYVLLYLLIFGFIGSVFFVVAGMMCEPLMAAGFGWLYFAIMGLISVALGVFGSVFNTYASLYLAKDNDLLLAMPVPPTVILMVRLSGVYAIGLMYELIVMIPVLIVWFLTASLSVAGVIFTLLIPLVLSVFVLILSAVLGWIVALVSERLKHKNVIVVVLSLAFIAAYYYFNAQAYSILQNILADPQTAGENIKSILYPLYHMGLAAEGNVISMLIFTAIAAVLFAVVYLALSRSFLRLATTNRGTAKVQYKEQRMTVHSVKQALLQKEFRRFLGNSMYMLNCGLGIVFMIVAATALLIKREFVMNTMHEAFAGNEKIFPLIGTAVVCLCAAMNDISAPSVSLEGKNLWLVQVFPVSGRQVLMAKLKLHLILTLVPAAVLTACVEWVLKPSFGFAILIPAVAAVFVLFMAAFGLMINLKMPNLTWTSEIIPIKQSLGVMITLFGGWAVVVAFVGAYAALMKFLTPFVYLIGTGVLLLGTSAILLGWLRTKGAEIFETL